MLQLSVHHTPLHHLEGSCSPDELTAASFQEWREIIIMHEGCYSAPSSLFISFQISGILLLVQLEFPEWSWGYEEVASNAFLKWNLDYRAIIRNKICTMRRRYVHIIMQSVNPIQTVPFTWATGFCLSKKEKEKLQKKKLVLKSQTTW